MTKKVIVLLALLCLVLALPLSAGAAAPATPTVSISGSSGSGTVTVRVSVSGSGGQFGAMDGSVIYDAETVEYASFSNGSVFDNCSATDQGGSVKFSAYLGSGYKAISGTVISMTFKITDPEAENVSFSVSGVSVGYLDSETNEIGEVSPSGGKCTIKAHEHSYTWKVTKEATCKNKGEKVATCSCGDTITESIPKTDDHKYGAYTLATAATCKKGGTEKAVCSICGDEKTRETAKSDVHSFGEWKETKAATCVAKGTETRTCSVCGSKDTRETKPADHKLGAWTTEKESTCTVKGTEIATCSVCNEKVRRPMALAAHKYEDGECTECGKADPRLDPENHPHEWPEWTVVKEPTCTEAGEQKRVCECTTEETEAIPALGHSYTDGKCAICGEADPDFTGEPQKPDAQKPAGDDADTQDTGAAPNAPQDAPQGNNKDNNNKGIIIWILIALAAIILAAAMFFLFFFRRRKDDY